VPFVVSAWAVLARLAVGPGWELLLPLLVVGPAVAAAVGGVRYTLAAGVTAAGACAVFDIKNIHQEASHRPSLIAFLATIGVTAFGMLAARSRERRAQELAQVRLVAEAAQRVLLRPVPARVGLVRMAVRYLSAVEAAQVGGDLYEVVATPGRVRLIVGDAEGNGLSAVRAAATVTSVFREAAREENCLAAIVARLEARVAEEAGPEHFITAILAEISAGDDEMQLISCGHPAPLMFGTQPPRLVGPDECSLPLGLADLGGAPRIPVTVPFEAGEAVLFYTDGASEARNKAGEFFPLASCQSIAPTGPAARVDPATLVDQLSDEIIRYIGHEPDDDVALLLACRDPALAAGRSARRRMGAVPDRVVIGSGASPEAD
jgi:serine phosphatase RsbU (regulator of sigma subunit)